MEAKAVAKYIRMSPQEKVRLVIDLVRGKEVEEAKKILLYQKVRGQSRREGAPVGTGQCGPTSTRTSCT